MGVILPFLSIGDRRVRDVIRQLATYELDNMEQMLPRHFTFHYYRFGPTVTIINRHITLVKEELERRRNDGKAILVSAE